MEDLDEVLTKILTEVGDVGNYYGGIAIATLDGKFFWSIEDWDGHNWKECPEPLYNELIKLKT